jgi:hypothetical protein
MPLAAFPKLKERGELVAPITKCGALPINVSDNCVYAKLSMNNLAEELSVLFIVIELSVERKASPGMTRLLPLVEGMRRKLKVFPSEEDHSIIPPSAPATS